MNKKLVSTPDQFVPSAGAYAGAMFLKHGLNLNALRTNDLLRKDEWIQFDTALVHEAMIRLNGIADLVARGLIYNLPNALGKTIVQWEKISDMDPAVRSMDGARRGDRDRQDFTLNNIPVYITHKDFNLNLRMLEGSRTLGQPIDVTQIQTATRLIVESNEDALFNGPGITVDGNTAYGYTTHPNRNLGTIAEPWTDSATTGEDMLDDVIQMITSAHGDRMFGPFMLYLPSGYMTATMDDYKASSDKTILQRIKELPGILDVKVSDQLAAGNMVLVQMTSDVVDLISGEQPRVVTWDIEGGFILCFKVLDILIPRIKTDAQNRCGVVHYSE